MERKIQKNKLVRIAIILIIIVLIFIIGAIIMKKAGIIQMSENKIQELRKAEIETDIQNIIDVTKQEIMETQEREATLTDLKEKLREQGYDLNETTGEVKYNEYYVIINSDLTIASIEEIITKAECKIMKVNGDELETLITIENRYGIEKIITPDVIIEGNGREKVALDRKLANGGMYEIKVKPVGKDIEEQYTILAEKVPNIVVTNKDTTGDGSTKTVEIQYPLTDNVINYYSLDDGATWQEYTGVLNVLEEDNKTIAAKTEAKEEKVKGKLIVGKTGEEIALVVSKSLLTATDKAIMKDNKHYRIAIKDEEYRVHTYVQNEDLVLAQNKSYGDGADVGTASENANSMVIVKVNGNLTINSGVTLTSYGTTYGGPKGMLLYVTGKLQNNGTVTMTARGAKAPGQNVYLWKNENNTYEYIPSVGGSGAAGSQGVTYDNGRTGGTAAAASNRRTAGGGGGGGQGNYNNGTLDGRGGNGSAGTSYSGGSGGGGGSYSIASNAAGNGGAGGNAKVNRPSGGYSVGAGGGAGNPGGAQASLKGSAQAGSNGTGGLLIIYADTFENNSTISANGSAGGSAYRAGGGGSGGGSVNIFCKTNNKTGTITATGGAGGTGTRNGQSANGGAGGTGSVTIGNI